MLKQLPPVAQTDVAPFLLTQSGERFEIPADGAIGLLALGDLGLIAWRQKRQQVKARMAERTHQHLNK